jgi:RNA polymerase sigma factor (sigma-70 family)
MTRDEIFNVLIPQVRCWVKSFTAKRPEVSALYDDMLGDANLKLVETLQRFDDPILDHFGGNFDKLSTYIRLSTWTSMTDTIRKSPVITEPHSKDERIPVEALMSFHPIAPEDDEHEPLTQSEALERLFETVQDTKDARILQAKLDGAKTAKDVSKVTGLSTTTIYRRLRVLRNRYENAN